MRNSLNCVCSLVCVLGKNFGAAGSTWRRCCSQSPVLLPDRPGTETQRCSPRALLGTAVKPPPFFCPLFSLAGHKAAACGGCRASLKQVPFFFFFFPVASQKRTTVTKNVNRNKSSSAKSRPRCCAEGCLNAGAEPKRLRAVIHSAELLEETPR